MARLRSEGGVQNGVSAAPLECFIPDFDVGGKTAEPKMAFNFAPLLRAACGGLRAAYARCARVLFSLFHTVILRPFFLFFAEWHQRAGSLPGCNTCSALCCESRGNQQLAGPPGAGVLPATNQLTGERSEPKSWGRIGAVNVVLNIPHASLD